MRKCMTLDLQWTTLRPLLFLLSLYLPLEVAGRHGRFVKTRGTQFVADGLPLYVNGFNAYYLSFISVDPEARPMISQLLRNAASAGLNVGRTWAFNNGGYRAMQISPGVYDDNSFQALDFVIDEAKRNGIRLILSLSNNYAAMGGKPQYVQWARNVGIPLYSEDAFFSDPTVKGYYKNYIKTVLTRVNTFTGVAYKDDPTIFAWELMNEARCYDDPSGNTLQRWVEEMASYVKSIDSNHLLEIGLEGFYGPSSQERVASVNPSGMQIGTDFLAHNQIAGIDFATVHSYPDQWLPYASSQDQLSFLSTWISAHIEDGDNLRKPVLFAEFGLSTRKGKTVAERDYFLSTLYSLVGTSASGGGAGAGVLFWQLLPEALAPTLGDGYEVVMSQDLSTANLIVAQSQKVAAFSQMTWERHF